MQGLAQHSLLSCGQMCDVVYKVLFEEGEVNVIDGGIMIDVETLMQGHATEIWYY
jgi:hypothetical protein